MGLFDFVKEAGASLFGGKDDAAPQRDLDAVLADKEKAKALARSVKAMDLSVEDLSIKFRDGRATVEGRAPSQAEREKIVLLIGNTQGVAQVDDRLTVAPQAETSAAKQPAPEQQAGMYTVQRGDTLSKIAKQHYGDARKYPVIFEANRPMLKDPDRIYPGQVLRIPRLES